MIGSVVWSDVCKLGEEKASVFEPVSRILVLQLISWLMILMRSLEQAVRLTICESGAKQELLLLFAISVMTPIVPPFWASWSVHQENL